MKNIKMRYSIEPRDRIYRNGYGFLSIAKSMGTHATKIAENLSHKYGQKLLDSTKISTTDAIKTASKTAIRKTAEQVIWLVIKLLIKQQVSQKKSAKALQNNEKEEDAERATPKKRYISPEERKQIVEELRLVPKRMYIFRNYWWINANIKNIHISQKDNKLLMN